MKELLVFLPGYYGSHLQEAESKKPLFLGARQLRPGFSMAQLSNTKPVVASVMKSVRVGPLSQAVYGPFIARLKKKFPESRVVGYGYDWRRNLKDSAADLSAWLEREAAQFEQVRLIGHSMGGLLICHLLQHQKATTWGAKIRGCFFIASPLSGVAAILRNLLIGSPFFSNPWLLPPSTLWSFGSPMNLLPQSISILGRNGSLQELDLTRMESWEKVILKSYSVPIGKNQLPEKIESMKSSRKAVEEALRTSWHFPLGLVVAEGVRTVDKFLLEKDQLVLDLRKAGGLLLPRLSLKFYGPGDGTVTKESQQGVRGLESSSHLKMFFSADHMQILNRPEIDPFLAMS